MQRRTLLKVGAITGALLTLAGGSLALLQPGRVDGRLSEGARALFGAVGPAVMASLWPAEPAAAQAALSGLLQRLEDTISGLPPALQAEVDELLTITSSAPGRLALVGLGRPWSEASAEQVTASLQALRESGLALRQQVFHALRDLTNAAYFADASTWALLGYPGQRPVPAADAVPAVTKA